MNPVAVFLKRWSARLFGRALRVDDFDAEHRLRILEQQLELAKRQRAELVARRDELERRRAKVCNETDDAVDSGRRQSGKIDRT